LTNGSKLSQLNACSQMKKGIKPIGKKASLVGIKIKKPIRSSNSSASSDGEGKDGDFDKSTVSDDERADTNDLSSSPPSPLTSSFSRSPSSPLSFSTHNNELSVSSLRAYSCSTSFSTLDAFTSPDSISPPSSLSSSLPSYLEPLSYSSAEDFTSSGEQSTASHKGPLYKRKDKEKGSSRGSPLSRWRRAKEDKGSEKDLKDDVGESELDLAQLQTEYVYYRLLLHRFATKLTIHYSNSASESYAWRW
jgi:hypothetical protein